MTEKCKYSSLGFKCSVCGKIYKAVKVIAGKMVCIKCNGKKDDK